MQGKDYYRVLGLAREASAEEVKRAYRRLAHRYHPDISREPNAEERFKQVAEAYDVLGDRDKRAAYDSRAAWRPRGPFGGPGAAPEGSFAFGGTRAWERRDFGDLFESLFGAGAFRPGRTSRTAGGAESPETTVTLTLEEAFAGVTKTLTIDPGPSASIAQRLRARAARAVKLHVPPGVVDGQRLSIEGLRGAVAGVHRGELYAIVRFAPHAHFRSEGRDIHLELPVLPWEAALGASVPAPTLGGPVEIRVPPGSQAGRKLRLRGRGLPGRPPGDQIVRLSIIAPPATTPEAEALYRRMAETMTLDPRARFNLRRNSGKH